MIRPDPLRGPCLRYADIWQPGTGVPNPGRYLNPNGGQPPWPYPLGPSTLFADPFDNGNLAARGWDVQTFAPATVAVAAGILHLSTANGLYLTHDVQASAPASGVTAATLTGVNWAARTAGRWLRLYTTALAAQLVTVAIADDTTMTLTIAAARNTGGASFAATFAASAFPVGTPVDAVLIYDVSGAHPQARLVVAGTTVASVDDVSTGAALRPGADFPASIMLLLEPDAAGMDVHIDALAVKDGI